ncbi:glycosyltransferase family 2 protein [Veillonella agrestimuris]|uniref:glycosyltransferase family 2 protein n=1 Tax=Veillonella agrestimuris TaxID=2941340 RepID=UPI0020413233|nr:glycosyltransferase family 2 protein [Veillonella agrestimuris]
MSDTIAAIVVTYNRKQLLLENVNALLQQTIKDKVTIVIIDNNSTDGTHESLMPFIENQSITYINTGENLGGAGGFQFGMKYAVEQGFDFVWIMDDDCIPQNTSAEELLKAYHSVNGKCGFLSSKVLWKDKSICTMNVPRATMYKNVTDFDSPMVPCVMASFVSFFVSSDVVKEVGLPIKEFYIWTDDWEYTRRISLKYPCYLVNNSVVIHKSNSNIGANIASEAEDRLDRYKYLYRNDVYLYRREGISGFAYECARLLYHSFLVLKSSASRKAFRLRTIWASTLEGLSFNPPIEYVKTKD